MLKLVFLCECVCVLCDEDVLTCYDSRWDVDGYIFVEARDVMIFRPI